MAQLVLDELLLLGKLDEAVLALFSRQHVQYADFSEYPGVSDSWLKHLARSPIRRISLASCAEVRPMAYVVIFLVPLGTYRSLVAPAEGCMAIVISLTTAWPLFSSWVDATW
jgi:hypothetical protein